MRRGTYYIRSRNAQRILHIETWTTKVEGKFDVERFLKKAMNGRFKAEGYGVEVASVKVTPSDRHEVIVHRV